MTINHQRLDRYISKYCNINRKSVKLMLAQRRINVDGEVATRADLIINKFSTVVLDNEVLQDNQPVYIMLHKPIGVVSSTKRVEREGSAGSLAINEQKDHPTVIDLINHQQRESLHIAGRLDLNTSGLVLLTNDSRWSKKLTSATTKVEKRYRVTLKNKLSPEYVVAFEQGMYFSTENITTRPAALSILSDHVAQVKLIEGRYHQIKRMFGRFRNPVIALHREAIGGLTLTDSLKVGESRTLSSQEVESIFIQ